jgi:hypothetical protein
MAWSATDVKAEALITYSVSGNVDPSQGITGASVISFNSVKDVTVDASSNIPIGSFVVASPPLGQTTTYVDTPFKITFLPSTYNGTAVNDPNPVTLTGKLSGTVGGPYQSSVEATFNPVTQGSFQLAGASSTLSILDNQKLLVPSAAGGTTTIEATVATIGSHSETPAGSDNTVPEPSTIALFLSTVGGLGLRRFVLNRRARNQA